MQIPDFVLGDEITEEQTSFFDTHGFIRFRGVATESEVDELLEALHALQCRFIAEERATVMGTPLKYGQHPDGSKMIQRFAFTSHYSSVIHDFVTDRRFEPVRMFIGEDARLAEIEKDGVVVNLKLS